MPKLRPLDKEAIADLGGEIREARFRLRLLELRLSHYLRKDDETRQLLLRAMNDLDCLPGLIGKRRKQ